MQCSPPHPPPPRPPPPPPQKKKEKKEEKKRRLCLLQSREKRRKRAGGKKGLQKTLPTAVVKTQCQLKEKTLPPAKSSRCSVSRKFLFFYIFYFISDFCKVVKLNAIPAENLLDFDCCKVVKQHALSTENI